MDYDTYLSMLNPEVRQQVSNFYSSSGTPNSMALPPQQQVGGRGRYQGSQGINPFAPNFSGMTSYSGSNPYARINPNRYSYMDPEDNPGDQLYADLIRAQTEDYNTRFAPLENFMAGQITATGTKSLAGDLERTRANMGTAVTNVQGQSNRNMGRMGLQGTSNVANSTMAVGGLVGGLNDTRLRDADRRQSILSGSLSGISQKARSTGQ